MTTAMTLAQKRALLVKYIAAEEKILQGQEYTIKDRSLTRADLRWVQSERRRLEEEISAMSKSGGPMKVKHIIFRDN